MFYLNELFCYRELGEEALAAARSVRDKFLKGQETRSEYIKLGKEKKEEYSVSDSHFIKTNFNYYNLHSFLLKK